MNKRFALSVFPALVALTVIALPFLGGFPGPVPVAEAVNSVALVKDYQLPWNATNCPAGPCSDRYFSVQYQPRQAAVNLTTDKLGTVSETISALPSAYANYDVLNPPYPPDSDASYWSADGGFMTVTFNRAVKLVVVWRDLRDEATAPIPTWLTTWTEKTGTANQVKLNVTNLTENIDSVTLGDAYRRTFEGSASAGTYTLNATGTPYNRAGYTLLIAESTGAATSINLTEGGTPAANPNQTCPAWVHDLYVANGPDGQSYRTWHPQIDPTYWCYFGHDHGANPDGVKTGYKPLFGYADTRDHAYSGSVGNLATPTTTSFTAADITNGTQNPFWPTDLYKDYTLTMTSGALNGQTRTITANTSTQTGSPRDQLSWATAFSQAPAVGNTFTLTAPTTLNKNYVFENHEGFKVITWDNSLTGTSHYQWLAVIHFGSHNPVGAICNQFHEVSFAGWDNAGTNVLDVHVMADFGFSKVQQIVTDTPFDHSLCHDNSGRNAQATRGILEPADSAAYEVWLPVYPTGYGLDSAGLTFATRNPIKGCAAEPGPPVTHHCAAQTTITGQAGANHPLIMFGSSPTYVLRGTNTGNFCSDARGGSVAATPCAATKIQQFVSSSLPTTGTSVAVGFALDAQGQNQHSWVSSVWSGKGYPYTQPNDFGGQSSSFNQEKGLGATN